MSLLDVLGQDRPVWRTGGGLQPVICDGGGVGQDLGGGRSQAEEDGGAERDCIGYDCLLYYHTASP
jgi:hypothetical protein